MTHTSSSDRSVEPHRDVSPVPPNRLTVSAAIALLTISALHTAVFAFHSWWGDWLAGPFRTTQLPMDAVVQFWGLPGGFVVPGVLLALLILRAGRRGDTLPLYVAMILGAWALLCVWMVGPSGFLLLLIPAALLFIANRQSRRDVERRG
jgi:hypothetical protein